MSPSVDSDEDKSERSEEDIRGVGSDISVLKPQRLDVRKHEIRCTSYKNSTGALFESK